MFALTFCLVIFHQTCTIIAFPARKVQHLLVVVFHFHINTFKVLRSLVCESRNTCSFLLSSRSLASTLTAASSPPSLGKSSPPRPMTGSTSAPSLSECFVPLRSFVVLICLCAPLTGFCTTRFSPDWPACSREDTRWGRAKGSGSRWFLGDENVCSVRPGFLVYPFSPAGGVLHQPHGHRQRQTEAGGLQVQSGGDPGQAAAAGAGLWCCGSALILSPDYFSKQNSFLSISGVRVNQSGNLPETGDGNVGSLVWEGECRWRRINTHPCYWRATHPTQHLHSDG